jgi:hypothetical protein
MNFRNKSYLNKERTVCVYMTPHILSSLLFCSIKFACVHTTRLYSGRVCIFHTFKDTICEPKRKFEAGENYCHTKQGLNIFLCESTNTFNPFRPLLIKVTKIVTSIYSCILMHEPDQKQLLKRRTFLLH